MTEDQTTVLVEGNYLLLDDPDWRDIAQVWDLSIFLNVPDDVLVTRLTQRWVQYGYETAGALARAERNDLPNARLVNQSSRPASINI